MNRMSSNKHADHILLPVTVAIYHIGVERPAMHWSFQMGVGAHSDQNLHEFIVSEQEKVLKSSLY